jgi:hypothetical protein
MNSGIRVFVFGRQHSPVHRESPAGQSFGFRWMDGSGESVRMLGLPLQEMIDGCKDCQT